METKRVQSIDRRYALLQGSYWMLFCTATGFIALYLQGRGLGNGAIGTVTAVFGLLAAVLQPALGSLCDRRPQLSWKKMILLLSIPFPIVCVLMLLLPGAWAGGVLMGLLMLLGNAIMPFINSASFYYRQLGETIHFGIARGIGSGMYALLALMIGRAAARFGIVAVPVSGILMAGVFLAVTASMPYAPVAESRAGQPERTRRAGFLRRYPAFSVMLLACLLMLTSHNVTGTYLLQILQSLGGDSSHLGVALALQAVLEVPVLFCFVFLLKRFAPETLMLISSAGYCIKAVCYALSRSIAMIYLTQLTQMLSFAVFAAASVYFVAAAVDESEQTTGQAFMTSMIAAGTVLGSLFGGWLLELFGMKSMLTANVVIALGGVGVAALSFCMVRKQA